MKKMLTALNLLEKRVLNFSDKVLDEITKEESEISNKLIKLNKNKVQLDKIIKKKLTKKDLFPLRKAPIEWWYFTGHLEDGKKIKLGYEFCIFKFHPQIVRIGPIPLSFLRHKPFLVLHFALTDKVKSKFNYLHDSGMSNSQIIKYNSLNLKLNNTKLKFDNKNFQIKSKNKIADINFNLKPLKKMVKHYDHGFKIMLPEHRTYYLTYSRLKTTGSIKINKKNYKINGLSWFDHQKMNLPQKSPLKGWDWFSIIFDDKTELMIFRLKTKKSRADLMGGSYINEKSEVINIKPKEIIIKKQSFWQSPKTKIKYPSSWNIKIPKLKLNLEILPTINNQELNSIMSIPIVYWEGACDVKGKKGKKKISGLSYVELVGYDKRLRTKILQSFVK